ncbi:MAG: DUF3866 family protein [Bacillota bacterium]|uniref:DUF3866 family protein n=1 Tax=Desulfurispora thermophila TaxID=265470 RepID=UPI000371D94A|nr:DUF3866 family protein [Desulfurispora thermophila]
MIRIRPGVVSEITSTRPGATELLVQVDGRREKAINYDQLTGPVYAGDHVLLNTSAVHLGLGTGGYHYVMANISRPALDPPAGGHIMKMRYAPQQVKVLAIEEPEHPLHDLYSQTADLGGMPVVVASLHSLLAPLAAVLKHLTQEKCRLAYIMTDGAALPLAFSRSVAELKEKGLLDVTVTCGHAFGGDLEAINVYSALLAARGPGRADVAIVAMGPGIVGSNSRFGYTGVEQGEIINAVNILQGQAIAVPRLSFADARARHYGISHHTRTALGKIALTPSTVVFPALSGEKLALLKEQIAAAGLERLHRVVFQPAGVLYTALSRYGLKVSTMGRGLEEDPEFFQAAAAAAAYTAALLR